jgi:Inclusion body protein
MAALVWSPSVQEINVLIVIDTEYLKNAYPDADSLNRSGLPPVNNTANFAVFDSAIRMRGREDFGLAFGLYWLAPNGQNQELYDYFWWDPTITVVGRQGCNTSHTSPTSAYFATGLPGPAGEQISACAMDKSISGAESV